MYIYNFKQAISLYKYFISYTSETNMHNFKTITINQFIQHGLDMPYGSAKLCHQVGIGGPLTNMV